jgi:hypothetical protein
MNEQWMRHFTKNVSNSLIIPSPKTYHPTKEQYYYNSAHVVSSGMSTNNRAFSKMDQNLTIEHKDGLTFE